MCLARFTPLRRRLTQLVEFEHKLTGAHTIKFATSKGELDHVPCCSKLELHTRMWELTHEGVIRLADIPSFMVMIICCEIESEIEATKEVSVISGTENKALYTIFVGKNIYGAYPECA